MAGTYDFEVKYAYENPNDGSPPQETTHEETLVVTGSGHDFVFQFVERWGMTVHRRNGNATSSGTQLTFTQTCPPPGGSPDASGVWGYTATAQELHLLKPPGSDIGPSTVIYKRRN